MVTEAKRALDWRKEYGRGGTDVGVARARDIANGKNLSDETVKRMYSFFSRHENNKAEHFRWGRRGRRWPYSLADCVGFVGRKRWLLIQQKDCGTLRKGTLYARYG